MVDNDFESDRSKLDDSNNMLRQDQENFSAYDQAPKKGKDLIEQKKKQKSMKDKYLNNSNLKHKGNKKNTISNLF